MAKLLTCLCFVFLSGVTTVRAETLSVSELEWVPVSPDKLGINVNYLLDGEISEKQITRELDQSGIRWLRYPGGEKSDNHLWSVPPFNRPAPRTALTGPENWPTGDTRFFKRRDGKSWAVDPMDFDEFMRVCQTLKIEPILVVAQQAAYKPKDEKHGSITEEELLETAVAWIRYCKTKGYRVRYWEVGNEPYLNGSQTPSDFAASWDRFVLALKAEDPSILVGMTPPDSASFVDPAHRDSGPWWPAFLAASTIAPDWLSLHDYPCYQWKGFAAYASRPVKTLAQLESLLEALAKKHGQTCADSMPLLVTEANSADWFGHPKNTGWSHRSSLGHGLVLFDMLGQYLINPRVTAAMAWNTRWLFNATEPQLWDAYDPKGKLLPTGKSLALWHDFYPESLAVVPTADPLRVYAGKGGKAGAGCLYLINKSSEPVPVELPELPGQIHVWTGKSPDDPSPTHKPVSPSRSLTVPAHSLLIIEVPLKS